MSEMKRSSSERSSRKAPAVVDVAPDDPTLPVKAPVAAPEPGEPAPPGREDDDEEVVEVLSDIEPATDAELDLIEAEIGVKPAAAASTTALVRRDPMGQY